MSMCEKVLKGLAACMPQTEEDAAIGCNACPYNGHPCGGDYQDNDHVNLPVAMIEDIRALLKAQEPRVMTLEEVKMLDSDYYYLESMRSPGKELREIVGAYGLTCVTWPSITWARQTMGDSGYRKTWRCWTSRPDEKRRTETPWES